MCKLICFLSLFLFTSFLGAKKDNVIRLRSGGSYQNESVAVRVEEEKLVGLVSFGVFLLGCFLCWISVIIGFIFGGLVLFARVKCASYNYVRENHFKANLGYNPYDYFLGKKSIWFSGQF